MQNPDLSRTFLHPEEKTLVFIDLECVNSACKYLNKRIDYNVFRYLFQNNCRLQRMSIYADNTLVPSTDEQAALQEKFSKFLEWLNYNGFNVVPKPHFSHVERDRRAPYTIDVDINNDILEVPDGTVEHLVLFLTSNFYISAVNRMKKRNFKVTVVGLVPDHDDAQPCIASELRKCADNVWDFSDFVSELDYLKASINGHRSEDSRVDKGHEGPSTGVLRFVGKAS